jgi:hypothetical protein
MGSGSRVKDTEEANKFGLMDQFMRVIGRIILQMVKEG